MIVVIYFLVSTITTLGAGGISQKTWKDQLCTIFLLLLGIIAYGLVISQMRNLIRMAHTSQNYKSEKVDDLEAWLISRESKSNFHYISQMQKFSTSENRNSYTEVI